MKRTTCLVFLVWPMVLLLYSLALCNAVVMATSTSATSIPNSEIDSSKRNPSGSSQQLQVSVPMLLRVPSCQKAYGELELRNTHPSETIFIHSIQKATEQTTIESYGEKGRIWDDESIPPQLHLSRLPSGSLALEPGQRAKVPFTFFPHYPQVDLAGENKGDNDAQSDSSEANDGTETVSTSHVFPAASSSIFELDWKDVIGHDLLNQIKGKAYDNILGSATSFKKDTFQPRNNLDWNGLTVGDEYQFRTTLVLKTSRGDQKVPLAASSVRTNPQGIPDTIYFRHDTAASAAATSRTRVNHNNRQSDIASIPQSATPAAYLLHAVNYGFVQGNMGDSNDDTPPPPTKDCFDLYLSNPDTHKPKRVFEILVSRPDLMSVQFDPNKSFSEMMDGLVPLRTVPPSPMIRQWRNTNTNNSGNRFRGDGPLILPPDSLDTYVATICTVVDELSNPFANRHVPPLHKEDDFLSEPPNFGDHDEPSDRSDYHHGLGYVKLLTDERPLFIGLKEMRDDVSVLSLSTAAGNPIQGPAPVSEESSLLKVEPERLDFHLTTTQNTATAMLSVKNKAPFNMRIVRIASGIRLDRKWKSVLGNNVTETMGLNITTRLKLFDDWEVDHEEQIYWDNIAEVRKGDYRENMIIVDCKLTSGTVGMPMETLHTTGSIVIRGTTKTFISPYDGPYQMYKDLLKNDMFEDEHFLVEIPFTVTIENGRVHAMIERSTHPYPQIFSLQPWDKSGKMISSLFFPSTRLQAIGDSEIPLPPQKYKGAKEISHDLLLVSSKSMPLGVKSVEVVEEKNSPIMRKSSLCNRFNVSITEPFEMVSDKGGHLEHVGFLSLRYKFGKHRGGKERNRGNEDELEEHHATTCYLNIITTPANAGNHQIPLIIFPGHLEVSTQLPEDKQSASMESKEGSSGGERGSSMSIQQLFTRLRNSVVGKAYLEIIEAEGFEKGARGLRKFLSQAYRKSAKLDDMMLKPVLMKIGALERNDVSSTPLILTNHNPIPLSVTIDSGDLEGMRLVLNKDSSSESQGANDPRKSMMNSLSSSEAQIETAGDGKYEGHPIEGLRQFLQSNDKAKLFTARFASRGAVSFNGASEEKEALLSSLYNRHSSAEMFRSHQSKNVGYGKKNCTDLDSSSWGGAMVVSADKTLVRHLPSCSSNDVDNEKQEKQVISIPPGGTARFDVVVTAPSSEFLNTDITRLMASGLSLSTSLGQVIPILITLEALQGQLHVSEEGRAEVHAVDALAKSENEQQNFTVIEVPLGLYWAPNSEQVGEETMLQIPPAHIETFLEARSKGNTSLEYKGTSLLLKSTFSRDVRLLEVESCNPLFHFVQSGENMTQTDGGIRIGHLFSAVPCSSVDDRNSMFPSYFQCALNWLGNRESLQPSGCGRLRALPENGTNEIFDDSLDGGASRVSQAFERAASILKDTYIARDVNPIRRNAKLHEEDLRSASGSMGVKTGRPRSDGIVPPIVVSVFAEAWDAWRVAANSGLGVLSSNLRATIEYETTSREMGVRKATAEKQNLSLSMHNLAVQSVLNAPRLLSGSESTSRGKHKPPVIKLPPVLVGETIATMIPLENPTAVPVKVRLAAPSRLSDSINELRQSDDDKDHTRLFLQSLIPPYVQNGRLNSVDNTSPHHLWWEGGGAFFMDDGRGNLIRSNHNITLKAGKNALVSLVNPSLHSNSAFIVGCGGRCGMRDKKNPKRWSHSGPHVSSPIGAAAAAGITLLGRQHKPQSQVFTTTEPYVQSGGVPGNGGPTTFAIPYAALDEIVIPPFGKAEVGPILFRPPGKFGVLGCELIEESDSSYWGDQTEEHCTKKNFETMVLLENSLTGLERVVLEGRSLQDRLDFLDPLPRTGQDEFGNIENRNGRSTLVFSGTSTLTGPDDLTSQNVSTSDVKEIELHNTGDLEQSIHRIYLADTSSVHESDPCTFGSFRLLNCWDSLQQSFAVNEWDVENVHAGFKLSAGETKTLFIEHSADCKRREESIFLHVEYSHSTTTARSYEEKFRGHNRAQENRERHKTVSLGVGYFMTEYDLAGCVPAKGDGIRVARRQQLAFPEQEKTEFHVRSDSSQKKTHVDKNYTTRIFDCIVLLIAFALLVYSWTTMPYEVERILCSFLPSRIAKAGLTQKPEPLNQRWLPAYRILARSDLTHSELVSIGHAQMRQGIIEQYEEYEMDPPESVGFERDRLVPTTDGQSHMLSDTLFPKREIELAENDSPLLPLGLRWGNALSRGIIAENAVWEPMLKTQELWLRRQNATGQNETVLELKEEQDIQASDDNDSYSSIADSYDSYNSFNEEFEGSTEESPGETSEATPEEYAPEDETGGEHGLIALPVPGLIQFQEKVEPKAEENVNAQDEGLLVNEVAVNTAMDDFKDFQPVPKGGKSKVRKSEDTALSPTEKKSNSKTAGKQQQQQQKGKQGNKKSEQNAAKATSKTKTKTIDAKSKTAGKSETETKGQQVKKASQKGETKESKKGIAATSKKSKQVGSAAGKNEGSKPTEATSPQASKLSTKDRGKSKNEAKKAGRGSSEQGKNSQNARKETQKDKLSKADKGKKERSAESGTKDKVSKSEKGKKERSTESEPKAEKISKRKKKKLKKSRQEAASSKISSPKSRDKKAQAADKADSTKNDASPPGLRPPPGLAPPPGFQTDVALAEDPSTTRPSPLGPMLDSILPSSEAELSPALVFFQGDGQNNNNNNNDLLYHNPRDSATSLPILAEPTGNQPPLFGSTAAGIGGDENQHQRRSSLETGFIPPSPIDTDGDNGFDVMDFLGSILNESVSEQQAPPLQSTFNQDPSLLAGNSPILSNPWASDGPSRASAYGISFDSSEPGHASILDAAVLGPPNQSLLSSSSLDITGNQQSSTANPSLLSPDELNIGMGGRRSSPPSSRIAPATTSVFEVAEHQRNNSQEEDQIESWLLAE